MLFCYSNNFIGDACFVNLKQNLITWRSILVICLLFLEVDCKTPMLIKFLFPKKNWSSVYRIMRSHSIESFILETSRHRRLNLVIISFHDSLASSLARFIFFSLFIFSRHAILPEFSNFVKKYADSFSQSTDYHVVPLHPKEFLCHFSVQYFSWN